MRKKILLFIIMLFVIIIPVRIFAEEYTIDEYFVQIKVNEDNSLNIIEKIRANFHVERHGIIRKIPLRNNVVRLDGSKYTSVAKIKEIKVSEKNKVYTEGINRVIKIGDPDITLTGKKDYEISYTYKLGNDNTKDYDELYFNIIGSQWDTSINGVSFEIIMPKEFDKSNIGFSSGKPGSISGYDKVEYFIEGYRILGKYTETLYPGEALTIRIELPEGYFTNRKNSFDLYPIISVAASVTFLFISFFIWMKKGKQNEIIETVEFYPPHNYNSLDTAFYFNGNASSEDVISLLIYLGNEGYLSIEEIKGSSKFFKKNDFRIHKLKDYDGNNEEEEIFFNGLFWKGNTATKDDLKDSFYVTINMIKRIINSHQNRTKIFKDNKAKKFIISLLIIVTLLWVYGIPIYDHYSSPWIVAISLLGIIFGVKFFKTVKRFDKFKILDFLRRIVLGFAVLGAIFILVMLPITRYNPSYLMIFIIGFISMIIMNILRNNLSVRTTFGAMIYGKIKGFKNFIEFAEKDRIESLIEDNPQYFYHIIPYAYVLGVSKKWIRRFETLNIRENPNWYYGDSSFDYYTFDTFMKDTISSVHDTMTHTSTDSSSGGGSSDSGSGGGGGSSW